MQIADFKVEQWMNDYEGKAVFNMTDTCVSPFTFQELTAMDQQGLLSKVKMDYGTITGDIHLKEEILKLYQSGTVDSITMAQGCLQANEMVMETLLEAGDTVVTYTPSYQQFTDLPRSIGCHVTTLQLYEENGWQPRKEELEAVFAGKVKLVILNNPNNPTGTVFHEDYLQELYRLAKENQTYILCDEVYRSPDQPSICDEYEKGISTSSLSKMFSLAGLRLGWIKGPAEVIAAVNVRRDYSIISTGPLIDALALIALQNKENILARSCAIIDANKASLTSWLKDNPAFSIVMPQAGTVGFLKYDAPIASADFARYLLDQTGVFYVPGSCFDSESHLRLGLTADHALFLKGLQITAHYLPIE